MTHNLPFSTRTQEGFNVENDRLDVKNSHVSTRTYFNEISDEMKIEDGLGLGYPFAIIYDISVGVNMSWGTSLGL